MNAADYRDAVATGDLQLLLEWAAATTTDRDLAAALDAFFAAQED